MSREHLYKAKRMNWRELPKEEWWVEGLPGYGIRGNITEIDIYKGFANCETVEIDPDTLCEYTRLTDKNSRKIFENDIVKIGLERYEVWWNCDSSSWTLSNENESRALYLSHNETIEVVGNIFDNTSLLKDVK